MQLLKFRGVRGWVVEPASVGILAKIVGVSAFAVVLLIQSRFHNLENLHLALISFSIFEKSGDIFGIIFLHILVSPVFENLFMAFIIHLVQRFTSRAWVAIFLVAIISFFAHGLELSSISAAFGFAIFAVYYLGALKARRSWFLAWAFTAIAHAVSNLIAIVASLV